MASDAWRKARSSLRVVDAFRSGNKRESDIESEDEPYDQSGGRDHRVPKKKPRQVSSGQSEPPKDELPERQQRMPPGGYTAQQPYLPQSSPAPLSYTSSWATDPTDPQPPSRTSTWASKSSNYSASSTASQYPPSQNTSTYSISTYRGHTNQYPSSRQHDAGQQQPQQPCRAPTWGSGSSNDDTSSRASQYPSSQSSLGYASSAYGGQLNYYSPPRTNYPGHQQRYLEHAQSDHNQAEPRYERRQPSYLALQTAALPSASVAAEATYPKKVEPQALTDSCESEPTALHVSTKEKVLEDETQGKDDKDHIPEFKKPPSDSDPDNERHNQHNSPHQPPHSSDVLMLDPSDSSNKPDATYGTSEDESLLDELSTDEESEETESCFAQTPLAAADGEFLQPVLSPLKREIIGHVMQDFYSMFDTNSTFRTHGEGPPHEGSQPSHQSNRISCDIWPGTGLKRSFDRGGASRSGGDEEDDPNNPSKAPVPRSKARVPSLLKFACPYYKHARWKHQKHRSCAGPGWDSVHRVKEHLYRKHRRPTQCGRCKQEFQFEADLTAHSQAAEPCVLVEADLAEGFDGDQEKELRRRRKLRADESEEDRWKKVYKILFPEDDDALMPSPYYEYQMVGDPSWTPPDVREFAELEEYCRRELPKRVRTEVERRVEAESQPLEDRVKEQLLDIVRDAQAQLFHSYQRMRHQPFPGSVPTPLLTSLTAQGQSSEPRVSASSARAELGPMFVEPPPVTEAFAAPGSHTMRPQSGQAQQRDPYTSSHSGQESQSSFFPSTGTRNTDHSMDTSYSMSDDPNDTADLAASGDYIYQRLDNALGPVQNSLDDCFNISPELNHDSFLANLSRYSDWSKD